MALACIIQMAPYILSCSPTAAATGLLRRRFPGCDLRSPQQVNRNLVGDAVAQNLLGQSRCEGSLLLVKLENRGGLRFLRDGARGHGWACF